jgi:hypothetical protein
MCLLLKLLQLQPDKEIIVEFIKNEDYKYVRVLGEFFANHLHMVVLASCTFLMSAMQGFICSDARQT